MSRFVHLKHVDQIRQAIVGFEELIKIYERDDMLIANYVHNMPSIFEAEDGVITENVSLRRECRGLVFYGNGELMSRPFQKFPNLNEWKEASVNSLDFSKLGSVMDKADGSMIRMVYTNGKERLATKMGVTDTSIQAEEWLKTQSDLRQKWEWLLDYFYGGFTPIFEWTSPENRIVLRYDEPALILTAVRHNLTGEYIHLDEIDTPFPKIKTYDIDLSNGVDEFIETARKESGIEGYIFRWHDGAMVKLKTDEYVDIHRTKDEMRSNRHIANLVFQEKMDDVYSMLDAQDQEDVRKYVEELTMKIVQKQKSIVTHVVLATDAYKTRKDIAVQYVPTSGMKGSDAKIFYHVLDGKDAEKVMMEELQKRVSSDTAWAVAEEWLGIGV